LEIEHLHPEGDELANLLPQRGQPVFVIRRSARPTLVFAAGGAFPWLGLVHASGAAIRVETDARGLAATLVDPAGRLLAIERRSDGLLIGLTVRQGPEGPLPLVRYSYDAADDLVAVRTAAGVQRFEYDEAH